MGPTVSNLTFSDFGPDRPPAIPAREATPLAMEPALHVEPDGGDLNHLLNALFRHRWLIGGIVAGCLAIAVAAILLATPRYAGEARILLERSADTMSSALQSVIPGLSVDTMGLNSQVEVLRSRALAREVADQLQLAQDPEFNAALQPAGLLSRIKQAFSASSSASSAEAAVIDAVQRRLDVRAIEGSQVIELRFSSEQPEKAAAIANAFSDRYLAQQLEGKLETTARTNTWLDERVTELRNRVALSLIHI